MPKTVKQEPYFPEPSTEKYQPRETMEMAPPDTPPSHPARVTGIGGEAPESSEKETWHRQTLPSAGIQPRASIEALLGKVAHKRFLDKLGAIAETENKYIIASFVSKYSEQFEDTNPQLAAELLQAALDIAND